MFSKTHFTYCSVLLMLSLLQTACSVSYSLEKSSDSVSTSLDSLSSITSISTSSSGGDEKQVSTTARLYEEDIAAVTVLYVSRKKDTDNEEYQRQIARIAGAHGISDWERDGSSFLGMGKGLRRAGILEVSIGNLPYFNSIKESPSYSLVLDGYRM